MACYNFTMSRLRILRLLVLLLTAFVYSLWHGNFRFKKIIIHCTDSEHGNRDLINMWHQHRGWVEIGYNFVILNGHPLPGVQRPWENGRIEKGRTLLKDGAHARGDNRDSIGISLIGKRNFTEEQIKMIRRFVIDLMYRYNISIDSVFGHYEMQSGILQKKTCPNIDMHWFRDELRREMGQTYGKPI